MNNYTSYRQQLLDRTPGTPTAIWPWRFIIFSVSVLFFSIFLYIGIEFGYVSYLKSHIDAQDKNLSELTSIVPEADQEEFLGFYSQLANLQTILDNHVVSSRLFTWLERNTNANVFFDNFSLNSEGRLLSLSGVAESYQALVEQLEAFRQSPEVKDVSLRGSGLDEARVRFQISITFHTELFAF